MSLHENDFFPNFDAADEYRAQRVAQEEPSRLRALEARVRELELARIMEARLAGQEAAAQRAELALQGQAIIALLDRLKALEARADGQEGTFEA